MRNLSIVLLLVACSPAFAGLLHTYDFSVTATTGVLAGQTSTGSFSYITDEAQYSTRINGLYFEDFSFDWNGSRYTESEVMFGSVWLDTQGLIDLGRISSFFGNNCSPGRCSVTADHFAGQHDTWNVEAGLSSLASDWAPNGTGFRYHDFGSGPTLNGLGTATIEHQSTSIWTTLVNAVGSIGGGGGGQCRRR